jgi:hypothetical protein
MSNPNKTTRTVLRWTHLLAGWLIGVFIYTPAHNDETFVLLMQAVVVLTGLWMWQQARIRRLYLRSRVSDRLGPETGKQVKRTRHDQYEERRTT